MESEMSRRRIWPRPRPSASLVVALLSVEASACKDECATNDASQTHLIQTIPVPGNPLDGFDVSWVDSLSSRYYLADRGNAGIEVIDAARGEYLRRIGGFSGDADHDHSGPNGVLVVPERNELWAGDGDSTVKIVSLANDSITSVSTGGNARADELSYDPEDHLVLVVNNAEVSPDGAPTGYFATLISTEDSHAVAVRLSFPNASAGLEQSVWDPSTAFFYLAIPELDEDPASGAIAVIDPKTASVVETYPVRECAPAGLALGPNGHLLLGCSGDAIEAGFAAKSVIMDVHDGSIIREVGDVGGSDEVWFNPGDGLYYLAARDDPRGPVLGIIDASSDTFRARIPTSEDSKSVAVDAINNRVFVALTPTMAAFANDPLRQLNCENGCVGVFSSGTSCDE
jgi:DNA-binding beta-propeller fold protein YncE